MGCGASAAQPGKGETGVLPGSNNGAAAAVPGAKPAPGQPTAPKEERPKSDEELLEEKLAEAMGRIAELELKCWAGEDVSAQLNSLRAEAEELRGKGVKPSPGVLVFRQIDVDKSETVDRKELERMLKALPVPQGVTLGVSKDMWEKLDDNADGAIDLEEWLKDLRRLPGLRSRIQEAMDPETGRLKGYRTLEEQLAKLMGQVAESELKCWAGEDVAAALEEQRAAAKKLQGKGVKPSPGVLVFRQIDVDGSGTVDRKELQRMLKALPKKPAPPGVELVPFEELMAKLDSDESGDIDLEEWLWNLQKLPGLRFALQEALDPETGRIKGYRSLADQLAKLLGDLRDLEKKGAPEAELDEKRAAVKKLREKKVVPSPGVLVFRQVDADENGRVDRKELQALLGKLPRKKPAPGVELVPFEELLAKLDSDQDGTIDLEEWLSNLQKLPGLFMAVAAAVDPETQSIRTTE